MVISLLLLSVSLELCAKAWPPLPVPQSPVFRAQLPHTPQLTELQQQVVVLHPTAQGHLTLSTF